MIWGGFEYKDSRNDKKGASYKVIHLTGLLLSEGHNLPTAASELLTVKVKQNARGRRIVS